MSYFSRYNLKALHHHLLAQMTKWTWKLPRPQGLTLKGQVQCHKRNTDLQSLHLLLISEFVEGESKGKHTQWLQGILWQLAQYPIEHGIQAWYTAWHCNILYNTVIILCKANYWLHYITNKIFLYNLLYSYEIYHELFGCVTCLWIIWPISQCQYVI